MNKATSIIRIATLLTLSIATFVCIFSEPLATTSWAVTIAVKLVGFGTGYATYRLYKQWQNDPLIRAYEKWADKSNA